jgi:hypothetical protein
MTAVMLTILIGLAVRVLIPLVLVLSVGTLVQSRAGRGQLLQS